MKIPVYFIALFLVLLFNSCSDNNDQGLEGDFILTVDLPTTLSPNHSISLEILSDIDVNSVFLAVNDSIFKPNNFRIGDYSLITGDLQGLLRYEDDDIFDEIIVSYLGLTDIIYDPLNPCPPSRSSTLPTTLNAQNHLIIEWNTCHDTFDTDYSQIVLTSTYYENYITIDEKDTTIFTSDSLLKIPLGYVPFTDSDSEVDKRRRTTVSITNIKGGLPGERLNISNSKLPITFYVTTNYSGSINAPE